MDEHLKEILRYERIGSPVVTPDRRGLVFSFRGPKRIVDLAAVVFAELSEGLLAGQSVVRCSAEKIAGTGFYDMTVETRYFE